MDNKRLRQLAGLPLNETLVSQEPATLETEVLTEMKKPKHGQAYGANDTGPPEDYTAAQLSRVADLLFYANKVGGKPLAQNVFKLLNSNLRGEFNYSNWKYREQK
jgi:hypothetical protein